MYLWVFSVSFALFFSGCYDSKQPTPLFPGLNSYSNFSLIKDKLGLNDGDWTIIEDTRIPEKNGKPFNYLIVEIDNYLDLNVNGSLQLDFYNDRLMSSWFYPSDSVKYVEIFERSRNIRLSEEWKIKVKPHTIVKKGKDHRGRYYVGWLDAELHKEKNMQVD